LWLGRECDAFDGLGDVAGVVVAVVEYRLRDRAGDGCAAECE
jgi:hypothetical protein